jgi:leucyl-tRNA synthetase
MPRYDAQRVEAKWQSYWEEQKTFVTPNTPPQGSESKGKLYVLDMFPYPSGAGLHVGHPEGYTATDIVCRYGRMQGKHVLHPMGWDAFGLPAEQYAIDTGTHPRVTTYKNIDTFRRQLKMLGFSYDWSREFSTTDPDYFHWTQWIFLKIFDTWYDADHVWTGPDGQQRKGKGRPISELPIPESVTRQGNDAVRRYQDQHRLAYQDEAPVNWCPALGTVLANEEVTADGRSDRGNHPVERRPLRQWKLRITSYAERLGDELDGVDWPESVKLLQRNWIGKSVGAEVDFYIGHVTRGARALTAGQFIQGRNDHHFPKHAGEDVLRIYTTRPDTLFGATYMVIAPEHPLVGVLTTPEQKAAVEAYRTATAAKSDLDRTDLAKGKSGVFTGSYAINPVNGAQVPIWVADYVLMSYGTGAIMAVPAHDSRDFEFAQMYNIPIVQVVQPPEGNTEQCFTGDGIVINSGEYNGLTTAEFKTKIAELLASKGLGRLASNYRLRDWLFSRQRYWGEPFPLWHELDADGKMTGLTRTVHESDLPVNLPDMDDFKPKGTPDAPLNSAPAEWLYKTASDGTRLKRETNSMPQWAGSCWYYLRFADNKNPNHFIDPEVEKYWLPVDLYIGGAEHAVLHLLYSRFWHKVLFDRGHVTCPEPFTKLVNQGMILGEMEYTTYVTADQKAVSNKDVVDLPTNYPATEPRPDGLVSGTQTPVFLKKLTAEDVVKKGDSFVLKDQPEIVVDSRSFKMSKSRGNVINPDDIVKNYGADSLRLYEMFMGPLEQTKPWSMSGVEGVYRFLGRVWRMFTDERNENTVLHPAIQEIEPTAEQLFVLHKTIKGVTEDLDRLSFNTVISKLMEFCNEFGTLEPRPRAILDPFVLLLSPLAPHMAEELWSILGHDKTLAYEPWPQFDESKLVESEVEIPVQINGKLRGKIKIPADASKELMLELAKSNAQVAPQLDGKTIVKEVVIPGKMVNFVIKG